jgi:hypothetical protein
MTTDRVITGIQLASVGVALCSTIAAAVSAYFSFRSSRTAADAAETNLVLRFRSEYASDQMLTDLRCLREWRELHGHKFAKIWRQKFDQRDEKALTVDRARRRVSSFFGTIFDLHHAGLVPTRIKKLVIDLAGIDLLYDVVELLELELAADPDARARIKENFYKIRQLRPPDRYGQPIAPDPLSKESDPEIWVTA